MKTYDFTFPDTGLEVVITKVNPGLANDLREFLNRDAPEPPYEEITTPGPMKGKRSPRLDDPDYVEKIGAHNLKVNELVNQFYIENGVYEIKDKDWKKRVKELRDKFGRMGYGEALYDDDKTLYIFRIAAGTGADLQDLFNAIMLRSEPSEGEIEKTVKTFRTDIQQN